MALDGIIGNGKSLVSNDAWSPPQNFPLDPLHFSVTQPQGSFCQIDARFSVPVPPDVVFDIITDPNNRRVFKNIQEVTYRKVLQDDGNKQIVEVEQVGRWRFLVFSGSFTSRVLVEQDRQQHTMIFDLLKQGMMKKFSGSWKIDAFSGSNSDSRESQQAGSWVTFNQVVEPSMIPPWPFGHYVRGVTAQIVKDILCDLQIECRRIAESKVNIEKSNVGEVKDSVTQS